jgi:hypothetical protein
MATFHLLRTREGRLLLTTERVMRHDEMDQAARYLQTWSEGPTNGVLLIPDCVFELEVVDGDITIVQPAVAREAVSHPPVVPEQRSTSPIADAIAYLLEGGVRMKAPDISRTLGDAMGVTGASVRTALNRDSRFDRDDRGYWALVPR